MSTVSSNIIGKTSRVKGLIALFPCKCIYLKPQKQIHEINFEITLMKSKSLKMYLKPII